MERKPIILLVDDEEINLSILEAILIPIGYDVVKALNGEEAIRLADPAKVDLILMDAMMPVRDGFDATRIIKQSETGRIIPVVMVTSLKSVEDRVHALESGADDFLDKPVDPTELRMRVKTLINIKKYNELMVDYQRVLEREKNTLLKEIHHRVKNNMQIIISLLNRSSRRITDPAAKTLFLESQHRIRSMAAIHEELYRTGQLSSVNMGSYMKVLTEGLTPDSVPGGQLVRIKTEAENMELNIVQAMPCGLIMNELITNCIKYAFPENRSGLIRVQASRTEAHAIRIVVGDDGVGMPENVTSQTGGGFGLSLVRDLVMQLDGKLRLENIQGATWILEFTEQ